MTSPIIAIYGVSPFYIFHVLNLSEFLLMTMGLTLNVFMAWLVHIYIVLRFPQLNRILQFIITYVFNFLIRFSFLPFIQPLEPFAPKIKDEALLYPIIASFGLNALVMVICNSIVRGHRQALAEKENQALKLENSEAQKQVLMQQLQPHFLFNSLSVLKSLIGENQKQAEDYAVKLSEFLRYSVQAPKKETVSLREELRFAEDYLELQKLRFDDSFHCKIELPDELMDRQIPVFALQTLVENAFKHNYFTAKRPLNIKITFADELISVWNNKVSIKVAERSQTGLQNLQKRYELIVGKGIKVVDGEDDFCVCLPLLP
jgi:two-component system, LytTR family, sensor kinase